MLDTIKELFVAPRMAKIWIKVQRDHIWRNFATLAKHLEHLFGILKNLEILCLIYQTIGQIIIVVDVQNRKKSRGLLVKL